MLERNPAGVTFGWGVTFSDDVLDTLYAGDDDQRQLVELVYEPPAD